MPSCTPSSTTTTHFGFCKPADGETNWGTAYRTTMDAIDTATEPAKMSKGAALDVLEEIQSQLSGRIEALKDEMED